jgi:diacylglycerol kinase (ATP)
MNRQKSGMNQSPTFGFVYFIKKNYFCPKNKPMTFAFIFNPRSSSSNHDLHLRNIQQQCPNAPVLLSKSIEDTHHFIQTHADIDIFVACGGDGTIASVAQALMHTPKILACLPLGSGNGFAKEHGFSPDTKSLFAKLAAPSFAVIDTININQKFCINVSGMGFDARVAKVFESTSRGFANYIKCSMREFFSYKNINISLNQGPEQSCFMMSIANTRQFGNNAYIAPMAKTNDALFDVVLLKRPKFWQVPQLIYRLFGQKLKNSSYIKFSQHDTLRVNSPSSDWQIDGEYCRIDGPVEIKIQASSLRVLK